MEWLELRNQEDWIDDRALFEETFLQCNYQFSHSHRYIYINETNPQKFLGTFLAAVVNNCHIFLLDPHWQERELQQVPSEPLSLPDRPIIAIPTGGSSGKIRFALHTWETLTASVRGFVEYFDLLDSSANYRPRINSYCLLPLYHVSGLMQFLRSFLTGGYLAISSYQDLKQGKRSNVLPEDFFISLVPTQLKFLIGKDPQWLARFHTVLVGGAATCEELLSAARKHQIRLAPTYGMTETASQVVTLKPDDFLAGNNSVGRVLPHAKLSICNGEGEILSDRHQGVINIESDSLSLGYYGELLSSNLEPRIFCTDDLGFFDEEGYLHILGRNSDKIITGGKNVFPNEVEAALLATGLVKDVCAIGKQDDLWGQAVTAIYVPVTPEVTIAQLKQALETQIARYKHPKHWIAVDSLPRNHCGKIDRSRYI